MKHFKVTNEDLEDVTKKLKMVELNLVLKLMIVGVFITSSVSLFYLYFFRNYIAEVHIAKALPISIVVGLSSIAIAIYDKN